MKSDIYIYTVSLPVGVNEAVTPCLDGYTIYISDRIDHASQMKALRHAIFHIENNDFERFDTLEIEAEAHRRGKE